jgi:hypothetical protein
VVLGIAVIVLLSLGSADRLGRPAYSHPLRLKAR